MGYKKILITGIVHDISLWDASNQRSIIIYQYNYWIVIMGIYHTTTVYYHTYITESYNGN